MGAHDEIGKPSGLWTICVRPSPRFVKSGGKLGTGFKGSETEFFAGLINTPIHGLSLPTFFHVRIKVDLRRLVPKPPPGGGLFIATPLT